MPAPLAASAVPPHTEVTRAFEVRPFGSAETPLPRTLTSQRLGDTRLARTLAAQGRRASWVASALGVHRNTISRWVNGRDPIPPARVLQLAALLGVPTSAIGDPSKAVESLEAFPATFSDQIDQREAA